MDPGTLHTEPSRHKCLVYDGAPSEQLPVVIPLLLQGLRERNRCLYLGDPTMIDMVRAALAERGIDVPAEEQRGALIFSSDRSYLDSGFDPHALVGMLRDLIDAAVRDGFTGLCATGDMRWELGDDANFEKLLVYEALLEQVFREKPLQGICQYHRDTLPARAVQDALLTHRSFYLGGMLNRDNVFYMPPELHLHAADPAARDRNGEWMCQQISRILKAERRRDEALEALERANADLERRVHERTRELEAANKELEAFSYSVSHDLRAPLRSIAGFSQALEEDQGSRVDASGKEHLGRIRSGVRRMEALIDGMLSLSRVARHQCRREDVDLSALARAAADELRQLHPQHSVELQIAEALTARGDRALLSAVLQNLLGNAWKFTGKKQHPRVEVGRRLESGQEVYYVRDNGAGFDMAYAGKLFNVFQRLHGQAEFPGTGVGLATVQRIIARHGGRLWAEGVVGEGATFYFTLETQAASS